jgi:hypothetical protein
MPRLGFVIAGVDELVYCVTFSLGSRVSHVMVVGVAKAPVVALVNVTESTI